ncbi:MAG: tRNA (guanosine(46)-N7)-methyltransferase TrmB, partial [Defluviitaleaceae bacterium]|nr:tRNA (guanosine(46)-N7)-methyltransferase TrmB [Defluviitaleaceae bacterium]
KWFVEGYGELSGKWNFEIFKNENPIHLEIGCGKGSFIIETAMRNPDINFIGLERQDLILVMALQRARGIDAPDNLRFICGDAGGIENCFSENEIDQIYINFCDPWRSRGKWRKRRLTHGNFLIKYENIMKTPKILFKTDDRGLFQFSMDELKRLDWTLEFFTFDLHADLAEKNDSVVTEYEQRFLEQGKKICSLSASKLNKKIQNTLNAGLGLQ